MIRIACLHTAQSNVAVFEAALPTAGLAGVELGHSVREELLAAAERSGGLTRDVLARTVDALRALCDGADAVLLTCSTLGPAAEIAAAGAAVPIMRVDAALATEAVRGGGQVTVLCAVEATMEPTRLLFERAARATGAKVTVRLVAGAWAAFTAGDRSGYLDMVARAAVEAAQTGATQVALAQASMAEASGLADLLPPPLTSPSVGLAAAVDQIARATPGSRRSSTAPTQLAASAMQKVATPFATAPAGTVTQSEPGEPRSLPHRHRLHRECPPIGAT